MKNIIKKWISVVLAVIIIESGFITNINMLSFAAIEKPNISSEAAILMDANTKEILFEKNKDNKYSPASITKIMTALLVIENGNLDDTLTFSENAVTNLDAGAVTLGAKAGDKLRVKDALYGLMLRSANEIGNGLAEYISGSIAEFANKMTIKAKELGAKNTNFANPHGLTNAKHYTSAYDMALIAKAAFENPTFREIEATSSYRFPALGTNPARIISMGHKMTHKDDTRYYEGILGGKTGYTRAAGNTLVTVVERNGVRLIVVILKSSNTHYEDTKALLDYGFSLKGVNVGNNRSVNTGNSPIGPGANLSTNVNNNVTPVVQTKPSEAKLVENKPMETQQSNTNNANQDNNVNLIGPGQVLKNSNLKDGWNKDETGWLYQKEDKSLAKSEIMDIKGYTYWFDDNTYMAIGWRQDSTGKWYYMKESGEMYKSKWILYKNLWYYMSNDGSMLTNTTTPDGYKVNNDGVWIK